MVFSGTVYAAELDDKGDGKARSQAVWAVCPLHFQEAPRGSLSPIKPQFLLSEVPAAQT